VHQPVSAVIRSAGPLGGDAVQAIFATFHRQTQRQRSILRLALVVLMVLVVRTGTPNGSAG
jgi:hypothetical protein